MARELKPCGTPAAYRRHLRKKQTPCKACQKAARDEKRAQRAAWAADDDAVLAPVGEVPDRALAHELAWQAETLRVSIEWAHRTGNIGRLPSLMKERRETLTALNDLAGEVEDEGGALGGFLGGPLGLVGGATASA